MSRPVSFLLAIGAAFLPDFLGDGLPRPVHPFAFLPWLLLIPLPFLLARRNHRLLLRVLHLSRAAGTNLRLQLKLQEWSVPVVFGIFATATRLPELAQEWAPESQTLQLAILLGPLALMEWGLRYAESATDRTLEAARLDMGVILGQSRLIMVRLVLAALFSFTLLLDLAFLSRELEVFFLVTGIGSTLALALLAFSACVALPLLFRFLLPTSQQLRGRSATDVQTTAAQLGFDKGQVLELDTGMRTINAALVGVLRWPRYLILSDGILSYLDPQSLRGVVAHEVGHARGKHVLWIACWVGSLALLFSHPAVGRWLEGANTALLGLLGGAAFGLSFYALRALFHRFELEADQMAAESLGGAGPCISALQRVQSIHGLATDRAGWFDFHPSFRRRILNLLAWEQDSAFRRHFAGRGRAIRRALLVLVGISLALTLWSQSDSWRYEFAMVRHYSGDFSGARELLAELEEPLEEEAQEDLELLRNEVEAAIEIVGPGGGDWVAIRDELASGAWQQGIRVLADEGPKAAHAWFGLALSGARATPLQRSLYLYCSAIADEDRELAQQLRQHIDSLEPPAELRAALEAQ